MRTRKKSVRDPDRCREPRFGELLSAHVDGELEAVSPRSVAPLAAELENHLAACASCRLELAQLRALSRRIEVPAGAFAADPNFVARFRQHLDNTLGMPAEWWRLFALRLAPMSLAALVLTLLFGLGDSQPTDPLGDQPLADLEREVLATGSPDLVEPIEIADWTVAWLGQPLEDSP